MRDAILDQIVEVAPGLHTATTFPAEVLRAIARHARRRSIRASAETGSGASTLLFSHLAEQHTVFADDAGSGSVSNIKSSPLLRRGVVRFVEGPTQKTLPRHVFENPLDLVLLDGPHAYPFPDLEYFFLYPHLRTGALLIVDDIDIPSVHNMFEFLRRDAMFRLEGVVHATAFLTRTEAPTFDPFGDGWREQNYNRKPLARYKWKERAKDLIPRGPRTALSRVKRKFFHKTCRRGYVVEVSSPRKGVPVGRAGRIKGRAVIPPDASLWVLVRRENTEGWWIQGKGPVAVDGRGWFIEATYGEARDVGYRFEICALAVGPATTRMWTRRLEDRLENNDWSPEPVALPAAEFVLAEDYARVTKQNH